MDVEEIRRGLQKPGKTQRGLAQALGVDPSAVTRLLKGERQLKAAEIEKVRQYLASRSTENEPKPGTDDLETQNFRYASTAPDMPARFDLPVMGTGEGGEEGVMLFNGEIVDRIGRPPFLANAVGAYAVYVVGSSMEPRYFPGELLYVHPGKPVTIGSFVLVQARPRADGEAPRALIARLEKRTGQKVILGKLNPARQIELQAKDIVSIHKIVGSGE